MSLTEILLTALLTAVGALCGILWSMMTRRVSAAERSLEKLGEVVAKSKEEMAEFRVSVAYASKDYITSQQMAEFVSSLTKFKETIFEKLDVIDFDMRKMFEAFRDKLENKQDKEGRP